MSDKVRQRGEADSMAFDIDAAALPALWKADPSFVSLAKYLYGDDVTLEQVQKDLFGKANPNRGISRFVHHGESGDPACGAKGAVKFTKNLDHVSCPNCAMRVAGDLAQVGKMDPTPSDVHANEPLKRKKKALVVDERALQTVGKAFIELVEKAYDAGLIDDEGNLNTEEIEKSQQYVRDHAGRFASKGGHVGRTVARIAGAGILAGTGAALASKSPALMRTAGSDIKFVSHHLKSADPVERHVARSLLPHALKSTGKAVGVAGTGAVTAAGGVYEGSGAYQDMREHRPSTKAARLVSKDWKDYDEKRKRQARGDNLTTGGLVTGAAGATGGILLHDEAARQSNTFLHHAAQSVGLKQSGNISAKKGQYANAKTSLLAAKDEGEKALQAGRKAKKLATASRRVGWGGLAAGAGLAAAGAYESHRAKETKAARYDDEHDVLWEGDFSKVDEDKRQVFGWASVAELDGKPVIDLQGDYIHPDELEKSAYDYVLKARVGGDMHARVDEQGNLIEKADKPMHVSDLIESVVFTPEKCEAMGIQKNLSGRWWVGFKVNDDNVWDLVKKGERTGFSIHGAGWRKNIDASELDPEAELIGKAYQVSEDTNQFIDNLCTLEDVTGSTTFGDLAKHLAHGINLPQINQQQGRNAGVYGSTGSGVGGLTGGLIGAKFGHAGEGAGLGAGIGGLTGTVAGVHAGKRPQRPPSVHAAMGGGYGTKAARDDSIEKAVSTTNRMGGPPGQRQDMYQQYALQQATEMLAPQVAQHVQALQEQRWQQQMIEQQMLQQQAQQAPQDFSVRMGPYANHQQGSGQTQNPMAPSQQGPTTGTEAPTPHTPQTFSV